MAECIRCAFARFWLYGNDTYATVTGCQMNLTPIPGPHDCPMFEREPGSDDDKGERDD